MDWVCFFSACVLCLVGCVGYFLVCLVGSLAGKQARVVPERAVNKNAPKMAWVSNFMVFVLKK